MSDDKPVGEMTFEEAMSALEAVVGQLESGEVELETSIDLYERGALLKKRCEQKLREAEEKVALIAADENGDATGTQPFDPA